MTSSSAREHAEQVLERMFMAARDEQRTLTAEELMAAIGLKRPSINSTYAHINQRRKEHNADIQTRRSRPVVAESSERRASDERDDLKMMNARLRRDLAAERARSEGYARVIRRLAIEVQELKYAPDSVVDARPRFAAKD